jgi:hypothetical protein
MENLYINDFPELIYYPVVSFNGNTGICEISGESYMEETYKFYLPIIKWLEDFTKEGKPVEFNFKLTYFNTSSSRLILEILEILKRFNDKGGKVNLNWYYNAEDPDMLGEISGFEGETGLKIQAIVFTKT